MTCEICGHTGVCKACEADRGDPHVVRLPDLFCGEHDTPEVRQGFSRITYEGIFARLLFLADTLPSTAWQVDDRNPLAVKHLATVQMAGYRVAYIRRARGCWGVQVYGEGLDPPPVYAADGPSYQPAVIYVQAGPWLGALLRTLTLREGVWS